MCGGGRTPLRAAQGRALLLCRVPVGEADASRAASAGAPKSAVGVGAALALIDGSSAGAASSAAVALAVMLRAAPAIAAAAIATAASLPHSLGGGPLQALAWPPKADHLRSGGAREAWAEVLCALGASAAEVTASPGVLAWSEADSVSALLADVRVSNALQRTARWGAAAATAGAAVMARPEPDAAVKRATDAATQALIARMQKELTAGRAEPELPNRSFAQQYTPASKFVQAVAAARAARETENTRAKINKLQSQQRVSARRGNIIGAVAVASDAEAAALRAAAAAGLHAAPYIGSALWASFAAMMRGGQARATGPGAKRAELWVLNHEGAMVEAPSRDAGRGERSLLPVLCMDAVVDVMTLGLRGASVMGALACCAAGDRVFAAAAVASGTLRELLEHCVSHVSAATGTVESEERRNDVSRRRYLQISAAAVAVCARGCARDDSVLGAHADYLAARLLALGRIAGEDVGGDAGFVVLRAVAVSAMYICATANVLTDQKVVGMVSWLLDSTDPVVLGFTGLAVMELATTEDSLTVLWREKILQRFAVVTARMVASTEMHTHAEYARALANVVGANWRLAGSPVFAPKWRSLGGVATIAALLSGRQFGNAATAAGRRDDGARGLYRHSWVPRGGHMR